MPSVYWQVSVEFVTLVDMREVDNKVVVVDTVHTVAAAASAATANAVMVVVLAGASLAAVVVGKGLWREIDKDN